MTHRILAVTAVVSALAAATVLYHGRAAADADATELMQAVFDQARVSFEAKMKLSSPGGLERELDVFHKQMPGVSATYIEIRAPFNLKDTRFLSWDRDSEEDTHLTYLPMLKRSVQVPNWTLRQSFLGSDFYMVDIAIPDMNAWAYSLSGEAAIDSLTCTMVEGRPLRPEEEAYSRVLYCIDEEKLLSLHTEFFDEEGALLKVWRPEKIENIDGVWIPRSQAMRDVQRETESRLEIVTIEMHTNSPEEIFRKAHLDR